MYKLAVLQSDWTAKILQRVQIEIKDDSRPSCLRARGCGFARLYTTKGVLPAVNAVARDHVASVVTATVLKVCRFVTFLYTTTNEVSLSSS